MNTSAQILAQIEQAVPGGLPGIFFGYGPLGAFCWWLTRLVDRQRRENAAAAIAQRAELAERDALLREVTDKHVTSMRDATHKISGLSRALVYNAATHATGSVKAMAQREVDRWDRGRTGGE